MDQVGARATRPQVRSGVRREGEAGRSPSRCAYGQGPSSGPCRFYWLWCALRKHLRAHSPGSPRSAPIGLANYEQKLARAEIANALARERRFVEGLAAGVMPIEDFSKTCHKSGRQISSGLENRWPQHRWKVWRTARIDAQADAASHRLI